MSSNHFKAELLEVQEDWAIYKYFPDIISFKSDFGLFKINLKSLANNINDHSILNYPKNLDEITLYRCKVSIAAIISKLKSILKNGEPAPKEIFHIS